MVVQTQAAPPAATSPSPFPIDLAATRAALTDVGGRVSELIASIPDSAAATNGLRWKQGDTATHIIVALRAYTDFLAGDTAMVESFVPAAPGYHERMAEVTTSSLSSVTERNPRALSQMHREALAGFLAASANRDARDMLRTPMYGPTVHLSIAAATALLLGEQVIHGLDIARSLGRPWAFERRHALLILPAVMTMLPLLVDQNSARGSDAVFNVHVRGGSVYSIAVRGGVATTEVRGPRSPRAACHLSADPTAFLLVGYGRIGQWNAIARGKIMAYGRKPWLGLGFKGLFHNP